MNYYHIIIINFCDKLTKSIKKNDIQKIPSHVYHQC